MGQQRGPDYHHLLIFRCKSISSPLLFLKVTREKWQRDKFCRPRMERSITFSFCSRFQFRFDPLNYWNRFSKRFVQKKYEHETDLNPFFSFLRSKLEAMNLPWIRGFKNHLASGKLVEGRLLLSENETKQHICSRTNDQFCSKICNFYQPRSTRVSFSNNMTNWANKTSYFQQHLCVFLIFPLGGCRGQRQLVFRVMKVYEPKQTRSVWTLNMTQKF